MGLLGKIFGNHDDTETAAGEGSDDSSPDRETIEIEPYDPAAAEPATATGPSTGRVPGGHLERPRSAVEPEPGSDERPHELTRRRIARPSVSTVERPAPAEPVPVDVPEGDDPEEIDVSDQLDDVSDAAADLDASSDLIIEDEPIGQDDEEETSTSISVFGDAAASALPSSPPVAPELPRVLDDERHGPGSISPDTTQPEPEWTTMATDLKTPKHTVVEAGTEFRGTLKSSCPVVVHGTLDGEIDAPALSIASTGSIQGNVRVQTLRSSGTLAGSVDAGDAYVSGAVRSNTVIRARRLELALGGSGKGHFEITLKSSEVGQSEVGQSEIGQSEAPGEPEASTTRSVTSTTAADATSASEAAGAAGWDLPEADGSEPAPAKRTIAK